MKENRSFRLVHVQTRIKMTLIYYPLVHIFIWPPSPVQKPKFFQVPSLLCVCSGLSIKFLVLFSHNYFFNLDFFNFRNIKLQNWWKFQMLKMANSYRTAPAKHSFDCKKSFWKNRHIIHSLIFPCERNAYFK